VMCVIICVNFIQDFMAARFAVADTQRNIRN
jgi:hypothetical protein